MHFAKTLALAIAALALLSTNAATVTTVATAAPINMDESSCTCAPLASDTSFSTNATAPWLFSRGCEVEGVEGVEGVPFVCTFDTAEPKEGAAAAVCRYFSGGHWACNFL